MEANELRIGNKVFYTMENSVVEIQEIKPTEVVIWSSEYEMFVIEPIDSIEPLPLTNQSLRLFGFDENNRIYIGLDKSAKYLQVTQGGHVLILDSDEDFICISDIKNVHKLQNLFFALTGKELELK